MLSLDEPIKPSLAAVSNKPWRLVVSDLRFVRCCFDVFSIKRPRKISAAGKACEKVAGICGN